MSPEVIIVKCTLMTTHIGVEAKEAEDANEAARTMHEETDGREKPEAVHGRRREGGEEYVLCTSRWVREDMKKFCQKEGLGLTYSWRILGGRRKSH